MERAYYSSSVDDFIIMDKCIIFGELTSNDQFAVDDLQKNAWKEQIIILKKALSMFKEGYILFEYTIPRIGSRIDNVLIYEGIIFLLEFKVGESRYPSYAIDQITDYALDLSCFHKESADKLLVPILVCTNAPDRDFHARRMQENIYWNLFFVTMAT